MVLRQQEQLVNAQVDTTALEQLKMTREKQGQPLSMLLQWVTTLLWDLLNRSCVLLAPSQMQLPRVPVPLVQQAISVTRQECLLQLSAPKVTIVCKALSMRLLALRELTERLQVRLY